MRPTLGFLLDRTELRLRLVVEGDRERPIEWVHVSELDDPTEFLSGGELMLTTGVRAVDTSEYWNDYVQRLVRSGIAGIGFGIDIRFADVPVELVNAARRHGLPLLAVPGPVPFIAISKAVANNWARLEQRSLGSAIDAQRELIRAALSSTGPRPVVERLAKALGSWVLLLDADGELQRCSPESARRHLARIQLDIDRLELDRVGAAAVSIGTEHAAVLPIAVQGTVGGYLVVGREVPLTTIEHSVLTTAVGLLALDISGVWESRRSHRRAALAVIRFAVGGHAELASVAGETLGVTLPDPPVRVAVLGAPAEHMSELIRAAETQQGLCVGGALTAEYEPNRVAVLLPAAEGDLLTLEEVLHQVPMARGAVSEGVAFAGLPDAWQRARSVYFDVETSGTLLATEDVATAGLLAQLNNPNAMGWASTLLEPLDNGRSRLSLISTLRVFLAHNGQMEASAAVLGIHRHTLRYRLDRIMELLGRELDDPTTRAELWIALRLRELS